MAEGVGFEPTRAFALPVFKTGAINRSTTPPCARLASHSVTGRKISKRLWTSIMFRRTYFVTNKRIPFEQSFALTAEGGDNSQTRPRSEKASGTAVSRTASAYAAFKESEAHALFRGRGALGNPANRFEVLHVELRTSRANWRRASTLTRRGQSSRATTARMLDSKRA